MGIIIAAFTGILYYFMNVENNEDNFTVTESSNDKKLVKIDAPSLFTLYGYENEYEMVNEQKIWCNAKFELNPEFTELYKEIGITNEPKNAVVVYPLFTAVAYSEPGFYTYYREECSLDCLTVELKSEYDLTYQTSGNAVQVFSLDIQLLQILLLTKIQTYFHNMIRSYYYTMNMLHERNLMQLQNIKK